MILSCVEIKNLLERSYSMPFDVNMSDASAGIVYTCCPSNENDSYFVVKFHVHDGIRLVLEIEPQIHGGILTQEFSFATIEKQRVFFEYLRMLEEKGGKVIFSVNDAILNSELTWPNHWRHYYVRITKSPIPENENEVVEFVWEWLLCGFDLMFSLLDIIDIPTNDSQIEVTQGEGGIHETKSIRYERNPINRKLCLHKKGYNCAVCGMNFYDKYGDIGKNFIEVHHTTPVSQMGEGYILDVDRDLVPLCPNCHSMAHRKNPPYSVEELKLIISSKSST